MVHYAERTIRSEVCGKCIEANRVAERMTAYRQHERQKHLEQQSSENEQLERTRCAICGGKFHSVDELEAGDCSTCKWMGQAFLELMPYIAETNGSFQFLITQEGARVVQVSLCGEVFQLPTGAFIDGEPRADEPRQNSSMSHWYANSA